MQIQQVVQVRAEAFGSGYLIAPRLVLTAAHLLPAGAAESSVTVSVPGSGEWVPAAVRWWRYDSAGPVDAALLEIPADDPRWAVPSTLTAERGLRPQRWGRCVTGGVEIPVTAAGFPRQQRARGGDREELVGRVRPHGGGTFEILDDIGLLDIDVAAGEPTTTPWSGMSGAAVFPSGEQMLLGVVRADRRARHGTRLTCTGSEDLLACDGFRAVVREATGVDPQLEPAELDDLLESAPPKRELTSPTMLLRADAEVVSFHGRQDTLAELERWCLADAGALPSVRVLTAPGGQGKTRLARELMARLRPRGWVAGQVKGEPGGLRKLRTIQHPLLLVVDYAESRPDVVRALLERAEESAHPVRLLLLARSLGSWQDRVPGGLREMRLHALNPGAAQRDEAFRQAARDFSRRLAQAPGKALGPGEAVPDWPGLAATLPVTPPAANRSGAETALAVQMSALAALLRRVGPSDEQDPGEASIEARLLGHEQRYWHRAADERGMGRREQSFLAQAVAAAALCPAQDEDEARATVARLLPHEPRGTIEAVTGWLGDLYPSADDRYWGGLEPDRLAEHHASQQVVRDAGLLERLFGRAPDHQRVQILTVLARAAVAHANEGRTRSALTVVDRLRATLRRGQDDDVPLTASMLRAHSHTLPEMSHVLRDYALDVARELSRLADAAQDDPQAAGDRAWALHNLARRQLDVGGWDEARTAAGEAAALRERLVAAGEPAYREGLAESLRVLSQALRLTGDLTRAHRVGEQALDLFRALVEEGGGAAEDRERGLVRTLVNQSSVLWQLDPATAGFDQVARSDDHTDEAVGRARELLAGHPDLDPLLLPAALVARGTNLWRFQRNAEALPLSEEAVRTSRQVAGENPDAYSADLAWAQHSLSVDYAAAGRPRGDSMALEQEAIALLAPLAADLPAVHGSALTRVLHNLARDQFDVGDRKGARKSLAQVIERRRGAVRSGDASAEPELADAVRTLAWFHAKEGDHRAAVDFAEEAVRIYAEARLPLSAGDLRRQSDTTADLARYCTALDRSADALAAHTRALAIRRRLSQYAPSLYTQDYAIALHGLSDLYRTYDKQVAVRIVLRQALPEYRRHAGRDVEARRLLASCLYDLGVSYLETQAAEDRALPVLREAYQLRVELAAGNPRADAELAETGWFLGRALMKTSRFREAVPVAEHEVRLRRALLAAGAQDQEVLLCHALVRYAEAQTMTGQVSAAWRTARQAEDACRALTGRPDLPVQETAQLLPALARALWLCGRHDLRLAARAVAPARRGVRIYRQLVDDDPHDAGTQAGLRWALKTLTRALESVGRYDEARDVQFRRGA